MSRMDDEFWVLIGKKNKESYGRKHLVFEALGAGVPTGHPLASASCRSCMVVATVTITTPNNASAATMADRKSVV
jgi:hypothetical protein